MKKVLSGVLAGLLIAMGCCIYVKVGGFFGAVLFAFGLFVICVYGLNLFTGKIGYFFDYKGKSKLDFLLIILGNLIGAFFVALFLSYTKALGEESVELIEKIAENKVNQPWYNTFFLSLFCGILMFIAVNVYKEMNNPFGKILGVFLCVPIFILSGFEHCVANMFYFFAADMFTFKMLGYLLIMVLGNSVGAIAFKEILGYIKKEKQINQSSSIIQ